MTRSNVVIARQLPVDMKFSAHHHHHQHHQHLQHASTASLSHSTASDLRSTPETYMPSTSYPLAPHPKEDAHTFIKHETLPVASNIPHSVKGAPPHLRPAIRKRQNSESAKRSRQRRKEAAKDFYDRFDEQCERIEKLEQKVASLLQLVHEEIADEQAVEPPIPLHPSLPDHQSMSDDTSSRDAGASHANTAPVDTAAVDTAGVDAATHSGVALHVEAASHEAAVCTTAVRQTLTTTTPVDAIDLPAVVCTAVEDHRSGGQPLAFENELEALLDTCIRSHDMFD